LELGFADKEEEKEGKTIKCGSISPKKQSLSSTKKKENKFHTKDLKEATKEDKHPINQGDGEPNDKDIKKIFIDTLEENLKLQNTKIIEEFIDDANKIFTSFKQELEVYLTRKAIDTVRRENQALVKTYYLHNL